GERSGGFRGAARAIARQEAAPRRAGKAEGARGKKAMIERLIAACVRNKFLTLIFAAGIFGAGAWALRRTPLDALPDLSDVQVIVYTNWEGQNPSLIEDQLTYPI